MRSRPACLVSLCASLVLGLGAGCSSSTAQPGASDADAGDAGPPPCQPQPGGPTAAPAQCVREVSGTVRDLSGSPLAGADLTLCGVVCFGGSTDPSGAFRIRVNSVLPEGGYVVFAHGRPDHTGLFVRLPAGSAGAVALPQPVELAKLSLGAALPADGAPAATVREGVVTLSVQAGTEWELSFEDVVAEAAGRRLRYAKVPLDKAPPFAKGAALVYGLAPFQAKPSKPVALTLDEAGGLPAGAPVELVVMSDDILTNDNEGGLPRVAARGRVSADGKRVETDPGEGLDVLTWVAVRPAAR
ncbi:MAG TPA: carboxypeptidase-like regulatory domain-containing protein [Polyangiaceae bacterium]|nr:carboxypeptidase-like regulatory domain-containing protein [Polyangiaceae bacterium]